VNTTGKGNTNIGSALNQKIYSESPTLYRCTRCGKTRSDPKSFFFMSKTSPLFVANNLYAHICADCTNDLFAELQARYKDTKKALMIVCHYLDLYFSETLFEQIKDNANFSFGNYCKLLNGVQYKAKTFNNTLMEIIQNGVKTNEDIRDEIEEKWSKSDLKNKSYVISAVGYDCFEDENYNNNNRKFLFNTLADYLTDDVLEDQHKLQQVIIMVKTILQVENIGKLINNEFKKGVPDYTLMDKLSGIQDKFIRNINAIANENGISAKSTGKSNKGSNTLTNIMKEMQEHGFEEIKVNVVNSKLSTSYQEVAKANAHALIDELNLTSDEYAQMVATQSEMITGLQNKVETLTEEIRLLNIKNKQLQAHDNDKNKGDSS
jgi:hypothetical protein